MSNWRTLNAFFATSSLPLLEARMLVEKIMGVNRAWMVAHESDPLPDTVQQALIGLVRRRLAGEPMAYIMGEREFMGLLFKVNPAVLIPRPDTETLVERALDETRTLAAPRVLELGTGSGCIAISMAHYCGNAQVFAGDVSEPALALAKENADRLGVNVHFSLSDWFEAFAGQVFDVIVSNPPYIAKEDPHLRQGDVRFEPLIALSDFADGLSCYRTIIERAPHHLKKGGAIFVEHGWQQAQHVRQLLGEYGFVRVHSCRDLSGIERVSGGYWV